MAEKEMAESTGDPSVRDLAAGKDEAFAALYDKYGAALFRAARGMAKSAADAEDLVQDVFVSLVRARASLARVENLRAYLFASLRRAAAAGTERRRAERNALEKAFAHDSEPRASESDDRLEHALAALPTEQREVIALKTETGLTFAEVGAALEISPDTAASRYRYALEKLRDLLGA